MVLTIHKWPKLKNQNFKDRNKNPDTKLKWVNKKIDTQMKNEREKAILTLKKEERIGG